MRRLALLLVVLAACSSTLTSTTHATVRDMPSPDWTPGAINPDVTQANIHSTICAKGWTRTVRPPLSVTSRIKTDRMKLYGYSLPASDFELDHLVALELGGAPRDVKNLWPEPWESKAGRLVPRGHGAESKDGVENRLRAQVCSGARTLADAQQRIAADWRQAG